MRDATKRSLACQVSVQIVKIWADSRKGSSRPGLQKRQLPCCVEEREEVWRTGLAGVEEKRTDLCRDGGWGRLDLGVEVGIRP